ncbi:MAG TPA: alpha/beta hydrolase [Aggregatilineales bacterium]|nr:alpha/beta hydrolase [Aggregatilineales bacterium]
MRTKTIVFIHGLFMTYRCWDQWVSYLGNKGYKCIAVPWPLRDQSVEVLRQANPDPKLGQLTLDDVINKHVEAIHALDEKPVVIGHSLGGLMAQILLQRDLLAAAVAIDPAPPQGLISAKWSFIKGNWPVLNMLNPSSRPYMMPFEAFQYAFVNGLPLDEQQRAYAQVPPESLRIARGVLSKSAHVDFKKAHAPLLIYAGEQDHIVPASLNQANFAKYKVSPSKTDFKEWPGRTHYGFAQKGWEELADYALNWLDQQGV